MITISLKDFVLNGNFGPVKIGMTRDEVVNLLGEPEREGDFGSGYGGLIYAWYEFFYDKEKIDYEIIEKYGVPIFKFASGVEMDFYDNSGNVYYSDDWKGSREQPNTNIRQKRLDFEWNKAF
jgi:hypothetical protein